MAEGVAVVVGAAVTGTLVGATAVGGSVSIAGSGVVFVTGVGVMGCEAQSDAMCTDPVPWPVAVQ